MHQGKSPAQQAKDYYISCLAKAQQDERGLERQSRTSKHSFCNAIKNSGIYGKKIKSRP